MPITTTTSTISDQYLTDIADAIRSKNGSSNTYTPPQMATAINALDVVEYSVTITSAGNSYGAYVTYNSTNYYTINSSFNFTPGGTLAIHLEVGNSGTVTIYEDGSTLTSASNIINYNYTLPQHSITIALSYGMGASSATITTAGGGSVNIQELSVTPTTSNQTFNVSGIDGYKPVYVSAMPSGSATAPASISGTSATVSTGTNTLTLSKTVSVTPTVVSGYISSGTAGNSNVSLTASVTTKAAATITPGTSNQTIASGTYLTGTQTISGDANLVAGNIKSGVQIFGVTGTYTGGSSGPAMTLLSTTSLGTISTSSTSAVDTGLTVTVSSVDSYDALVVETSVNTVTNNRHTATVAFIFLTASSTVGTKNGTAIATAKWNSKISSSAVTTTRSYTTAYGIYPNSASISNGTVTLAMYERYSSTYTGTINGAYTTRVYGLKLYDLIGG